MRLSVLIERLQDLQADLAAEHPEDPDPEVVAAYQPRYPLSGEIRSVVVVEDNEGDELMLDDTPIVWIAVGGHPEGLSPYAPRAAFERAS